MSMDTACYITTLEATAPQTQRPEAASYAIIDLAMAHDFLKQLYSALADQDVEWRSLFEGSEWQPDWTSGPILVNLKNCDTFTQQLATDMESRPIGVLIKSPNGGTDLLARCQRWLFGMGDTRLLRFHEPRMLAPLLCVMGSEQRHQLISSGEQWSWHDGQVWRNHMVAATESPVLNEEPLISVSEDQLRQASHYRMAAQAQGFASYYESSLVSEKDPSVWVLNRLLDAHKAGMTKVSEQERWLRLAIMHGESFAENAEYRKILEKERWSANERLTAMESTRKSGDVSAA